METVDARFYTMIKSAFSDLNFLRFWQHDIKKFSYTSVISFERVDFPKLNSYKQKILNLYDFNKLVILGYRITKVIMSNVNIVISVEKVDDLNTPLAQNLNLFELLRDCGISKFLKVDDILGDYVITKVFITPTDLPIVLYNIKDKKYSRVAPFYIEKIINPKIQKILKGRLLRYISGV